METTPTILCTTLVPEKTYSILEWFDAVSKLEFPGEIFVHFSRYASIKREGNDWQVRRDRDRLRDVCLLKKADMLIIDTDTLPPSHAFIELNKVNGDIISGLVKNPVEYNCYLRSGYEDKEGRPKLNFMQITPNTGVFDCDAMGFGCVLIRYNVLKEIKFDNPIYKKSAYSKGHDLVFSLMAKDMGFKLKVNTNVICKHRREYRGEMIDRD